MPESKAEAKLKAKPPAPPDLLGLLDDEEADNEVAADDGYSSSLACTYFFIFSAVFQKYDLPTKLTVKNATGAKQQANSASRRSESNGRRPGPGFYLNPGKKV